MVEMLGYPEFILPFPVNMEEDHGHRPWNDWPSYNFELMYRDKAMRVETKDIEVRDISELPVIRAANEDDIPALEEFYHQAVERDEFEGIFHPLQLKSDNYVVCEDQNEIIGAAGTHFETPYSVQLGNIYVSPKYRGRGIGRALTTAVVLGAIKTQRVPTLFVNEENTLARKLYESIGFEYYLDFEFYKVSR
jgi:predicted GNAT family acetyltransferase